MRKNSKTKFNKLFEEFVHDRMTEEIKYLRKHDKEYIYYSKRYKELYADLKKELTNTQFEKMDAMCSILNCMSDIEMTLTYKTAIQDFQIKEKLKQAGY